MSQVWVVGEVLIDLIPEGSGRKPVIGGGPANTAKALSNLGIDTQFIDGISHDDYGQMAKDELVTSGVKLDYVKYSDKPTCLARVSLSDSGSASYEFVIENTATFDFTSDWLPNPQTERPSLLHIGTLATIIEPGASELFEWAQVVTKVVPIVFDPNIRPAIMSDRKQYVMQVERWVSISSAIKVSDEDIKWLYPSLEIDQVVNNWLANGPSLIVVTYGDKGLAGYRLGEKVSVAAVKVKVVDTVGAGDTVGAILVEAIVKDGLDSLAGVRLEMMLKRAAKAAAITVSRSGAKPPTCEEINDFFDPPENLKPTF
jgi:fructokinase